MNIKRGLIRLWVVGSVLWVLFICFLSYEDGGIGFIGTPQFYFENLVSIPFLWLFLYMGFWVSSGFSSDKKKDETNE